MNNNIFFKQINIKLFLILITSSAFCAQPVLAINEDALVEFGDAMQIVLPGIGLALTAVDGDKEGAKQWAWSGVTSIGTTTVLKGFYSKVRPNGSDSALSFPSGHTTAVFWGASFLDQRYGAWWGVPAYTAATVTAYSRIISDNHHIDDTLMGASIAMMSSWYWVTPHDSAVSLVPFQQNDAVGVTFHFDGSGKLNDYSGLRDDERWRYSITFGPAFQQKNVIAAPTATGTSFDLEDFKGTNDPTTTASAMIEWFSGKHRTVFSVEPFEARDLGSFTTATDFAGQTYQPGVEIRSAFRLSDIRLQYFHDLMPASKTILELGGGIAYQRTSVDLKTTSGVIVSSKATSDIWLPLINAAVGYQFNPRFSLVAELGGLSLSSQKQFDASLTVGYRLDRYWDAGVGIGTYVRDAETSELSNDLEYNVLMTYVGYSFY